MANLKITEKSAGDGEEKRAEKSAEVFTYSAVGRENLESTERADNFTAWLYSELKPFIAGENILEIGSGTGIYSAKIINDFPGSEVILSDLDQELISKLKEKFGGQPRVSFTQLDVSRAADFDSLPAKVDCAIASNVLEHVADDLAALKNVYAGLARGGRFILLVPAHRALYNIIDKSIGHYRRYDKDNLASKARAAGFKINKIFYFNFFSIFGWYFNGNILRRKKTGGSFLRIFNFLVPALKAVEKNIFRGKMGISLVMVLDK